VLWVIGRENGRLPLWSWVSVERGHHLEHRGVERHVYVAWADDFSSPAGPESST